MIAIVAVAGCDVVLGLDERDAVTPIPTTISLAIASPIMVAQQTDLTASITGAPEATIPFAFTASIGAVAPSQGDVTLDADGTATIVSTFAAPGAPGIATVQATVDDVTEATSVQVVDLITVGHDRAFTAERALLQDTLYLVPFVVSNPVELRAAGFWVGSGSTNPLKIGVYRDSTPPELLLMLPPMTPVAGRNELAVPPLALTPGSYSLGLLPQAPTNVQTDFGPGNYWSIQTPFASPLPQTYTKNFAVFGYDLAVFVRVLPQ